jgi:DNA ligase (NAD+)
MDLMNMTIEQLATEIRKHDENYWNKNAPQLSDADYDKLTERLRSLDPDHPMLFRLNTPKVSSSGKILHAKPMLSLNKAYSLQEVMNWASSVARDEFEKICIQPKYDGISGSYRKGRLATRGDGYVGEDITSKLPLIEFDCPFGLNNEEEDIRGEIVISNSDFNTIYKNIVKGDGKPFKNSRNAVSGIMNLDDISDMVRQKAVLVFVDYDAHSILTSVAELPTMWETTVTRIRKLDYPMDGIVLKLLDMDYAALLGNTEHHPRGALAYKFPNESKQTKLLNIWLSPGKGKLTPMAKVQPVDIGGVTIENVTLHNIKNVEDRDLRIGDTVIVERAGDVIPHISGSIPQAMRDVPPCLKYCPSCNTRLDRIGPELVCPNKECPEVLLMRLLSAVEKIGIERLGEPTLRNMMEILNVKSLAQVFRLTNLDLAKLPGFAGPSIANLLSEIRKARVTTDYQLLASLNIQGIGRTVAKQILFIYSLHELQGLSVASLERIDGTGYERATALFNGLQENAEVLHDLQIYLHVKQTKPELGDNTDRKPTVCFTGKMPNPRSYYVNLANAHGYEYADNVTAGLTLLVAEDLTSGSSKLKRAAKAGIKIMSLREWLTSMGASNV